MTELKIITKFINPPIPIRFFDWVAYRDPELEQGTGSTEKEAIENLIDQEDS